MQVFVTNTLLLAAFVAAGIAAIVTIRARFRAANADHGSWETALAEYRNLRDKGVLTAEEYRKIRTLVEPRSDSDGIRPSEGIMGGQPPASRRVG